MKKSISLIVLAAMGLAFFSCKQEELPVGPEEGPASQVETPGDNPEEKPIVPDQDGNVVFNAVMDEEESISKSTIAAGGAVSWESGDAISILWAGGSTTAATTDSGASATYRANVDTEASGGTYYAVYPASAGVELAAANELAVTIPSVQDGSFSSANVNVAKTTSATFSFKAIANVIKFTVADPDVTKVRIYSYDGTPLAGTCSVDVSGAVPAVSSYSTTSGAIEVAVSGAGTYYAVVLPGNHSEGLLFAPETASAYKRSAYADKSWTAARKAITDFGDVEGHARDLYVSASGSGKGLASSDPMSPAALKTLLETAALPQYRLLYGNTIHIQEDIAVDQIKVAYTDAETFDRPCSYTITGASAATAITPAESHRIFAVNDNVDLILSSLTLKDGAASGGGAINIGNTGHAPITVTCNNVTFSGNSATGNGGAVLLNGLTHKTTFIANDCTFSGNTAENGGAYFQSYNTGGQEDSPVSSFSGCTFAENTATAQAGAAQFAHGTATFTGNSSFTSNDAPTAGVFYVNGGSEVNVSGALFSGNSASGGNAGVISMANTSKAVLTNCTFSGNKASVDGGVAYTTNTAHLTISGGKASQNISSGNGGFARIYKGELEVEGTCVFENNKAAKGGVFYLDNQDARAKIAGATFTDNSATSGGVSYQTNSSYLVMNACTATGNAASEGGVSQVYKGTLTVNGGTFQKNTSTGGGGVFFANNSAASLTVSDASLIGNAAQKDSSSGSVTNAYENTNTGGAICATAQSKVILTRCYFKGNRAGTVSSNHSQHHGGALCINGADVSATLCNFEGNKGNRGSAVKMAGYSGGGLFKADRCSFHKNANYSRGTIYLTQKNVLMLNQCAFFDNVMDSNQYAEWVHSFATNNAICVNNCSFSSTKTYSSGNPVTGLYSASPLLMTNSSLIGNFNLTNSSVVASESSMCLANNVCVNSSSSNNSIRGTTSGLDTYLKYNTVGSTNANVTLSSGGNKTDVTASGFTWTPVDGPEGSLDLWKNWFVWNGPGSGDTMAGVTDITGAYDAYTVDASSWGGVLASMTNVGASFKAWLGEFSPIAYTINQHGAARGTSYWPGSYQN